MCNWRRDSARMSGNPVVSMDFWIVCAIFAFGGMITRRLLRVKTFQSVFAFVQQRVALLDALKEDASEAAAQGSNLKGEALYDLRLRLSSEVLIDATVYEKLMQSVAGQSVEYRTLFEESLCRAQHQLELCSTSSLRIYTESLYQLLCDEYLMANLYVALYKHSCAQSGRLAQSPLLAALAQRLTVPSFLEERSSFLIQSAVPREVISDSYAAFEDTPLLDLPSWSEDTHYLIGITRKKVFHTDSCNAWMNECDPYWSLHKPLLISEWVKNFKNFEKNRPESFSLDQKCANLAEQCSFGQNLYRWSLVSYLHWSSVLARVAVNWSLERISLIDRVLCVIALNEMHHIHTIPLQISMNEYIDIAKAYSSPKSSAFLNGLLEGVIHDLQAQGLWPLKAKNTSSHPSS